MTAHEPTAPPTVDAPLDVGADAPADTLRWAATAGETPAGSHAEDPLGAPMSALIRDHAADQVLLDLAVSAAGTGVWDLDLLTATRTWDRQMLALFAMSAQDADARPTFMVEAVHPEDRDRVRAALSAATSGTSATFTVEFRTVLPDGTTRWITSRGRALHDADGRAVRLLGTAQDTSDVHTATARLADVTESMPVGYLSMDTDWRVTYANTHALTTLGTTREQLVGAVLWQAFPAAVGTDFEAACRRAASTGQVVTVDVTYAPPLDTWYEVRATPEAGGVTLYSTDITARHHAQHDALRANAQQRALVSIAQALAAAESETDVLNVVNTEGLRLLSSSGAGLCLRQDERGASLHGQVRILATETFDADLRASVHRVPEDFPMPIVHTAVTGQAHYLPDRPRTVEAFPGAAPLYEAAGVQASAAVALDVGEHRLGSLSLAFAQERRWTPEERELVAGCAALTAQALQRISARAAERRALAEVAGIAETLQRAMLTAPPEPDHLQVAVRYAAAARQAQVGGDWYDAFITADGLTTLVIGDVTGHDMAAAAVMGQMRNVLRAIGFTLGGSPAAVLQATDRAAAGLGIETLSTAVVAQVDQSPAHRAAGTRLLRWSNAGHPPPLLISAEGTTCYLDPPPDLVLGLDPATERDQHEVVLREGDTVLLYTDGLIERRGRSLQEGLDWLAGAAGSLVSAASATGGATGGVEGLCDALLAAVRDHVEDDVALVALRAHPEGAPRPLQAGPQRVPPGLRAAQLAAHRITTG